MDRDIQVIGGQKERLEESLCISKNGRRKRKNQVLIPCLDNRNYYWPVENYKSKTAKNIASYSPSNHKESQQVSENLSPITWLFFWHVFQDFLFTLFHKFFSFLCEKNKKNTSPGQNGANRAYCVAMLFFNLNLTVSLRVGTCYVMNMSNKAKPTHFKIGKFAFFIRYD